MDTVDLWMEKGITMRVILNLEGQMGRENTVANNWCMKGNSKIIKNMVLEFKSLQNLIFRVNFDMIKRLKEF